MAVDEPFREIRARRTLWSRKGCCLLLVALMGAGERESFSQTPSIDISDRLPFGQKPIDYHGVDVNDAVAGLNARLEAGSTSLHYDPKHGYLLSLLKALEVPIESQLLVFSKTAANQRLIAPRTPRAIYFNDDVSVGSVLGASTLEVTAMDPHKGALFWVLEQQQDREPRLKREARCLACHVGNSTLQVPGLMVRSFLTDLHGKPQVGYSRITHATAITKRWGGWYVTGRRDGMIHRGNLIGEQERSRHKREPTFRGNVTDLKPFLDVSRFPSPHSDIVAHLVLNHQAHGQNLLIRAGYESRFNRRSDVEDRLLRYLLFVDEAPLTAPVAGTSGFEAWFPKQGARDAKGRSLRQFDLKTRLFRYRLSYLVQTTMFERLPGEVKTRLYRRLWDALTTGKLPKGKALSEAVLEIPNGERRAIIGILRSTQPELPRYWFNETGCR